MTTSTSTPEARPKDPRTRRVEKARAVIARLPRPVAYWLADRAGDIVFKYAHNSRRAATSNLRQVMGPVPGKELKRAVRGAFRNLMRSYYDLCKMYFMTGEEVDRLVDFDHEGWQRVLDLHRQGRSVILVGSHFGGFDTLTHILGRQEIPISAIIVQFSPAWISDFITEMRASQGLNMLLVEQEESSTVNLGMLKKSIEVLRRGDTLAIIADRNMDAYGAEIEFFGKKTVVATGVAKLALRTHSPVVVSFCTRVPGNRYIIQFHEPLEPEGSASNREDIAAFMRRVFSKFEEHIGEHPEQWVLMQRVWPDRGSQKQEGAERPA